VFNRNSLIASIYGNDDAVSLKSIDVHIHNLRCKLNDDNGDMIQTVRGFGYKLATETEKALNENTS
jgi:DNA-binding response OmpR family regulator